jgi:hypothetical protein
MNGRLRPGDYNVKLRVYDVFWKREVVSSVSVVVKEISDDAIASAGTVRLQGIMSVQLCIDISINLLPMRDLSLHHVEHMMLDILDE